MMSRETEDTIAILLAVAMFVLYLWAWTPI